MLPGNPAPRATTSDGQEKAQHRTQSSPLLHATSRELVSLDRESNREQKIESQKSLTFRKIFRGPEMEMKGQCVYIQTQVGDMTGETRAVG